MMQSELLIITFNSFFNHLFLNEPVSLAAIQHKQNPLVGQTVATIVVFIQKNGAAGAFSGTNVPAVRIWGVAEDRR